MGGSEPQTLKLYIHTISLQIQFTLTFYTYMQSGVASVGRELALLVDGLGRGGSSAWGSKSLNIFIL